MLYIPIMLLRSVGVAQYRDIIHIHVHLHTHSHTHTNTHTLTPLSPQTQRRPVPPGRRLRVTDSRRALSPF